MENRKATQSADAPQIRAGLPTGAGHFLPLPCGRAPWWCVAVRVVALALVLLGVDWPVCAAPGPFLKTSGLDIRNDNGQGDIVPLRGVNLGSWLLMEPWMCPMDTSGNLPDDWSVRDKLTQRFGATTKDRLLATYQDAWLQDSDFDRIAALGMNVVRLPFWYLNLQEEDGTWRADAFDRMDWAVAHAWQRGIYTILDLHGAHGGQRANADTTGRIWPTAALWSSAAEQDRMVEIWQRLSQHYNGNPAVAGYDLLNEPMDAPSLQAYTNLLDRCYRTIRTNDPDHIIILEATYGNWNFDMLPDPAANGWTNVVYQLHVYPWNVWNDVTQLNQVADNTVQDWLNHASWSVPCHIGEFNMAPEEAWKYAIERYSTNGAGWQMWAYKSTYTGGTTSWGVYNPNGSVTAVPNIESNSSTSISNKWAQWTTANAFALNPSHRRTLAMPVAKDDAYTLDAGAVLIVVAPGVLSNDTHLNLGGAGIQLQAWKMSDPAHGSVVLNTNGSFAYTANTGYSGTDAFRYKVWDGRLDSVRVATVSVQVLSNPPPTIAQIRVESRADGTGVIVSSPGLLAGSSTNIFAIARDAGGNFLMNVAVAWSLTNQTGGVVAGDLVAGADNQSATFTAHLVGSAVIQAATNGLAGQSGTLTVSAGPAARLVWTTQPGLATNGVPFGQQPVLRTADPFGNPSTNGLPATLNLTVAQSAGAGPLLGATSYNMGTAGSNGVVSCTSLEIDSAGTSNQLTASVPPFPPRSLLTNGNFNLPNSTATPTGWTPWSYGAGYANHEVITPAVSVRGNYDGSYQMTFGAANTTDGGGVYQIVPATAGLIYTLTVSSGVQNWWWPSGEMRLFFLDAGTSNLATHVLSVSTGISGYDIGKPCQPYQLMATAPAGTTRVKVEFAGFGGGSVWFDNSAATESNSLPALAAATTLPFTVHPSTPVSQTNYITGITDSGSGTFTLQFVGTVGVTYCLQATTNLAPPIVWETVAGSTNTVTDLSGEWSCAVTNTGQPRFYRSAVTTP